MEVKVCSSCKKEKPINEFARGKKCKLCYNAWYVSYRKNNPDQAEKHRVRGSAYRPPYVRHNLTLEQYNLLLNKFNGKCHICKTNKAVCIDHNHKCCSSAYSCGKCVRGILCSHCNRALGLFNDNLDTIASAGIYLNG